MGSGKVNRWAVSNFRLQYFVSFFDLLSSLLVRIIHFLTIFLEMHNYSRNQCSRLLNYANQFYMILFTPNFLFLLPPPLKKIYGLLLLSFATRDCVVRPFSNLNNDKANHAICHITPGEVFFPEEIRVLWKLRIARRPSKHLNNVVFSLIFPGPFDAYRYGKPPGRDGKTGDVTKSACREADGTGTGTFAS